MLEKDKLNTVAVLISKTLIDSYINHAEFVSVNNVFRDGMKNEINNPETSVGYII